MTHQPNRPRFRHNCPSRLMMDSLNENSSQQSRSTRTCSSDTITLRQWSSGAGMARGRRRRGGGSRRGCSGSSRAADGGSRCLCGCYGAGCGAGYGGGGTSCCSRGSGASGSTSGSTSGGATGCAGEVGDACAGTELFCELECCYNRSLAHS
jgi:hypothetical protein